MDDIEKVNDYLLKLKKTIKDKADFEIFNKAIVKKKELDDILCALIGVLPHGYKKILTMKSSNMDEYPSISMFNKLLKLLKSKLLFLPYYIIPYGEVNNLVNIIKEKINIDIQRLEHVNGKE